MKKIWKGKNEKSEKLETVGAVTHTHTHTHKHVIKDNVGAGSMSAHEKKKNIGIRTRVIVPLIVVLILISIVAVICVGAPFGRPSETAEINRDVEANKEEILAETTTVNAGETYTVPEDGIYKIEVHGGRGGSNSVNPYVYGSVGSKATGYVRAYEGNQIEIRNLPGRCELRGIRTQKVSRYRRQWMCSVYGSW